MDKKCPTYMGDKAWIGDRIWKSKKDKDAENNQFLVRHNMRDQIAHEKEIIEQKLPKEFTKLMDLISREVLIKKPLKIALFIANFLDLLLDCRNREEAEYHINNAAMRNLIMESKTISSQTKGFLNSKVKSTKTGFVEFSYKNLAGNSEQKDTNEKKRKKEKTAMFFGENNNRIKTSGTNYSNLNENNFQKDETIIMESALKSENLIKEIGSYDYTMDEGEDEEYEDVDINLNDNNVPMNGKEGEILQALQQGVEGNGEVVGENKKEDIKYNDYLEKEEYADEEADEKESFKNENDNNDNEDENNYKDDEKIDEENYYDDYEDEDEKNEKNDETDEEKEIKGHNGDGMNDVPDENVYDDDEYDEDDEDDEEEKYEEVIKKEKSSDSCEDSNDYEDDFED